MIKSKPLLTNFDMAFKIFEKGRHNLKIEGNNISVRKDAVYLSEIIGNDLLRGGGFVIFLIDKDNKKIGIQNCDKEKIDAFKMSERKNIKRASLYYICCRNVVKGIKSGRYTTKKENEMWIFEYEVEEDEN